MVKSSKMSSALNTPPKTCTNKPLNNQGHSLFWQARTRIILWYVALMTGFIGLSVPIVTKLVFDQVDARVRANISEKIDNFEEVIPDSILSQPKITVKQFANLLENFLSQQLLEDDTYLITILNNRLYRSSSSALPAPLQPQSPLIQEWGTLTEEQQGKELTSDPKIGCILYQIKPIIINGQVKGVFIVAHTTAGERQEAINLIIIVIQVLLISLILSILSAWFISGKILKPLEYLISTTRSIDESALNQRLPEQGSGEIAELAATFNEMMERLQQAFKNQQDFLNDAGHELRTPITIIRGHLELLKNDPLAKQETIKIIVDELNRMSRIVEDLIVLAKLEQPNFIKLETIDISAFTEELYSKAIGLAARRWVIENRGQGRMVADRQRITQAIMNLAQNAVQHTQEKDTITIGSIVTDNYVRFWVKDTGVGIPRTEQQRIFQRFARGTKNSRNSESTGLGLSIVRAITQAHEGWIELMSDLGVGSIFTLIFPLEPPPTT